MKKEPIKPLVSKPILLLDTTFLRTVPDFECSICQDIGYRARLPSFVTYCMFSLEASDHHVQSYFLQHVLECVACDCTQLPNMQGPARLGSLCCCSGYVVLTTYT